MIQRQEILKTPQYELILYGKMMTIVELNRNSQFTHTHEISQREMQFLRGRKIL